MKREEEEVIQRDLTETERAVLAHVVVDPDAWWDHVNAQDGSDGKHEINHEAALRAKIDRWQGAYNDAAIDRSPREPQTEEEILENRPREVLIREDYKTRAQRDIASNL